MRAIRPLLLGASLALAAPAHASFHFMQIEQAIGGVDGDTTQQAVQLRMRFDGQDQLQLSRLVVRDAAGQNPITLIDMTTTVGIDTAGSRVLIATPDFIAAQAATADFTMAAIPASYLAAGALSFEQDNGQVLWLLAWGGAGYTGPATGATTNDADGNFAPPFGAALPSASTQALLFTGAATAMSTTNAADYALTAGAAQFSNNAGGSVTVSVSEFIFGDGFEGL